MRYKILNNLFFLLLVITQSCQERIWDNPFDPECPKEIYTPSQLTAQLEESRIILNWNQPNLNISGYEITQSSPGIPSAIVGTPGKFARSWIDNNTTPGLSYTYTLAAKAGDNSSNLVFVEIFRPHVQAKIETILLVTTRGTLTEGVAASGVSSEISYTGGNGGTYNGETVTSTGVPGLTARLTAGTISNGSGSLTYTITGTPATSGTASFALNIGGQSFTLNLTVAAAQKTDYPAGSVFCASGETAVVEVINPKTGKIWMDRNLGATRAATYSIDPASFGDLYQWGRRSDGHQCRTSPTTSTLSSTDQPAHGNFIFAPNSPYDWRSPQNTNLWQGVNGINNPCPSGYRLPTEAELNAERSSWSSNNTAGAFASPLKLPVAGFRSHSNGSLSNFGAFGGYWNSTVSSTGSRLLYFDSGSAVMSPHHPAAGVSVRCLKN